MASDVTEEACVGLALIRAIGFRPLAMRQACTSLVKMNVASVRAVVAQPGPTRHWGTWLLRQGRAIASRRRVWMEDNVRRRIGSLFIVPTYELNRIGLKRKRREFVPALIWSRLREPATARAQCIQQLSSSPLKYSSLSLQAAGPPEGRRDRS